MVLRTVSTRQDKTVPGDLKCESNTALLAVITASGSASDLPGALGIRRNAGRTTGVHGPLLKH